jgi:hypothetical protein
MRMTGEIAGHKIYADCYDSTIEYRMDGVGTIFKTYPALEKAVKDYHSTLSKEFTNPTAYIYSQWGSGGIVEVTITSVDGDKYAWVKTSAGKRSKESRDSLYADRERLELAITVTKKLNKEIKEEWGAVPKWKPQS